MIYFFAGIAAFLIYGLTALTSERIALPSIYQARDIVRSLEIFNKGNFIWYGPDLTGGGQLPGPFYYYVIGPLTALFSNFMASYYLQYALAVFSVIIVVRLLLTQKNVEGAILFCLVFLSSPFFSFQLSDFWNPSFLFFFLALFFWSIHSSHSPRGLFAAALIAALAVQIHYSALLLLPILLAYSLKRQHGLLLRTLALFSLPFLPYVLYLCFRGQDSSLYWHPLGGMHRLLAKSLTFFSGENASVFSPLRLRRLTSLLELVTRDVYIFPGVIAGFLAMDRLKRNNSGLAVGFYCALASIVLLVLGVFENRYVLVAVWILTLVSAVCIPAAFEKHRWYRILLYVYVPLIFVFHLAREADHWRGNFMSATAGLCFLIAAFFTWRKYRPRNLVVIFISVTGVSLLFPGYLYENSYYYDGHLIRYSEAVKWVGRIKSETGWSYDEFRQRTFINGYNSELDLSLVYSHVEKASGPEQPGKQIDGLIIKDSKEFKEFSDVSPDFKKALSDGLIRCDNTLTIDSADFCFYQFTDGQRGRYWNNVGYAYHDVFRPALTTKSAFGVEAPTATRRIFYYNNCRNTEIACTIAFDVEIASPGILKISVTGDPLSLVNSAINPAWALWLEKPALEVTCANGIQSSLTIADNIGLPGRWQRSTFLAPFTNYYKIPCPSPASLTLNLTKAFSVPNALNAVNESPRLQLVPLSSSL